MAISWKLMDRIYVKAKTLTPRSKRERTFLGTIRYLLVELAEAKIKYRNLKKNTKPATKNKTEKKRR